MIKKEELNEIRGGSKWKYIGLAIGAAISFVVGLIDGYIRPLKCNK